MQSLVSMFTACKKEIAVAKFLRIRFFSRTLYKSSANPGKQLNYLRFLPSIFCSREVDNALADPGTSVTFFVCSLVGEAFDCVDVTCNAPLVSEPWALGNVPAVRE